MVKTKEKIKIIIADDHPLFRRGLKNAFADTPDIEVVDEAENGDELLKKVSSAKYNIALVDVAMPGKHGLDLLKQLREDHPKLPILVPLTDPTITAPAEAPLLVCDITIVLSLLLKRGLLC